MRIALVLASNLYTAPYVHYYTDTLRKLGVAYDIICWNRLGIEEQGVISFDLASNLQKSRLSKVIDYIRYNRFVKSKLTENSYDKIVVFTIANALMLFGLLKERYRNKYVFDIRDYSILAKYFPARFSAAIHSAGLTVISSTGFKAWLPENHSYIIRHNTNSTSPGDTNTPERGQTKHKILTIGSLTYYDVNREVIRQLADSPCFELEFVGSGTAEPLLKDFVQRKRIKNVTFYGRYAKEDEPKFLKGVSLLNVLMDDSLNSMTLLSNRFYLSILYNVPMMVNKGSEQARWVQKYNLGVAIDKQSDILEQITRYLKNFDPEAFNIGRMKCLEVVREDVMRFEAKFKEFLLQ
jgi:hypothetical protein